MNELRNLLIIMHGFQASGKSTTAKLLGRELDAHIVATHQIRAEIATKETAYTKEMTKKIYDIALERAESILRGNEVVIIDAMFAKRDQRNLAYQIAEKYNTKIVIVDCICPDIDLIKHRVEDRVNIDSPEAEGDKMEYYYRTKAVTEPIEGDETPSGDKPATIVVDTSTFTVTSHQDHEPWVRHLSDIIAAAVKIV